MILQADFCSIFCSMSIELLCQKFCEYLSYIRGFAPTTIIRYKMVLKLYTNFAKITTIEEVTDDNTRDFFYFGRTDRRWASNSFITYHKTLVVFFRWCVEHRYMAKNPMDDIEIPKLHKRLPPKLTKQDSLRLLEVVYNYPYHYRFERYRNHAIFATFLFTGIRRKELINLKFTDVDLQNLSIFINQGKGGKDRVLPIPLTLAESLRRYLEERKRLKKTCPEFFASLFKDQGFTTSGLKHLVDRFVPASKIQFNIHRLRHTFATLMLEGGCDIFSLSKLMGHSDIKTTTIYLAASPDHLRGQIMKHPLNNI